MVYTITFNPSLDYVIEVEDFCPGDINRTKEEKIFPGGKGINVSMVLLELGVDNTALGFIAGFTGDELERVLKEKGIRTDFIQTNDGLTRINVKLRSELMIDSEENKTIHQETEINGQGPYVSDSECKVFLEKIDAMNQEDILVLSGSVSKGVPQNTYAQIVKMCNEKGIKVIVDASSALLWNTLEHNPFLIKPNHHELGEIFNREIQSYDEIVFYAKELQNRGARNVLVSVGEGGAVLVAEDGVVYEKTAPFGKVINSVGAGDSLVAGFLAGYIESGDFEKALKLGVCSGSATAFLEGLATKEDIDKLLLSE